MSDDRLDSSLGSHYTPKHENHPARNSENATGRVDNAANNSRPIYAYHEAPSFQEMAPDFAERSPTTQRRILGELDELMDGFAQNKYRE